MSSSSLSWPFALRFLIFFGWCFRRAAQDWRNRRFMVSSMHLSWLCLRVKCSLKRRTNFCLASKGDSSNWPSPMQSFKAMMWWEWPKHAWNVSLLKKSIGIKEGVRLLDILTWIELFCFCVCILWKEQKVLHLLDKFRHFVFKSKVQSSKQ